MSNGKMLSITTYVSAAAAVAAVAMFAPCGRDSPGWSAHWGEHGDGESRPHGAMTVNAQSCRGYPKGCLHC